MVFLVNISSLGSCCSSDPEAFLVKATSRGELGRDLDSWGGRGRSQSGAPSAPKYRARLEVSQRASLLKEFMSQLT
jgi:hypothetical protein